MSGFFVLCVGQTRVNYREGQKLMTIIINLLVGISQFVTITFLLIGWFWSIAWGGLLIIHAGKLNFFSKFFKIQKLKYSTSNKNKTRKNSLKNFTSFLFRTIHFQIKRFK